MIYGAIIIGILLYSQHAFWALPSKRGLLPPAAGSGPSPVLWSNAWPVRCIL